MASTTPPDGDVTHRADGARRLPSREEVLEALRHPLRAEILGQLVEPTSPVVIARRLGQPTMLVSYRTRRLRDLGCAELVALEVVRSVQVHIYRATIRATLIYEALPTEGDEDPQTSEQRRRVWTFTT